MRRNGEWRLFAGQNVAVRLMDQINLTATHTLIIVHPLSSSTKICEKFLTLFFPTDYHRFATQKLFVFCLQFRQNLHPNFKPRVSVFFSREETLQHTIQRFCLSCYFVVLVLCWMASCIINIWYCILPSNFAVCCMIPSPFSSAQRNQHTLRHAHLSQLSFVTPF